MQRFLVTFLSLLFVASLVAQAPSGFRFQAVARDVDNNAMATDNIAVRVSLLAGGPSGAVAYSERHEVTTTDLGVFDLHIGNGLGLSGDMTTIDWGGDSYFIKIDMDPDGGTSYVNLGASQLLSVPYAMYASSAGNGGGGDDPTDELQNLIYDPATQTLTLTNGNSVTLQVGGGGGSGTDDQTISLSGTTLSIEGGNAVDLSVLQDGVNDADADPTNELQTLTKIGPTVTLSNGGGAFQDQVNDADADPTNEIQTLNLSGTNLSLSNGGGSVTLPGGGSPDLALPYYDETNVSGAGFHIQNDFINGRFGIAGSVGTGAENLPANNAGVMGQGTSGHGVYGVSKTSFFAGVQGVSESADGVGVLGYGIGGGVGGHFYTTSTGVAALTTGRGNVGIGIDEPEMKMHVGGDLFVQTNLGELVMGFPDNGHQWQFSTRGQGADLQFQSKPDGSNSFTTRYRMRQDGEFQLGDIGPPSAWMHIANNSTISKPHLKLEENGNDYARLELTNDVAGGAYWQVAGLPSTTASEAKLNFYFRNASGAGDRMTITGDGQVGINTANPSARLTINQGSQSVGTGLSFQDNTVNQDWHMTHGFALRFHYGNTLRSFINATTGAYTVGSDKRLKDNINLLSPVLARVKDLAVSTYHYKSDKTKESTIGLIAQEAKELFPELISYSEVDSLYGVNYAGFSMVAIKAIQEQQALIDGQQTRINDLEARLARLEQLISTPISKD
jgi:hypothetical protein